MVLCLCALFALVLAVVPVLGCATWDMLAALS